MALDETRHFRGLSRPVVGDDVRMGEKWKWDESLYAGSAAHYARGRMAYPSVLIHTIVNACGLNGRQRLLDLGCGPGSLLIPLFAHVREGVGVDPDSGMIEQARLLAVSKRVDNVMLVNARAEELPTSVGAFDVITAAQSFHWMDQKRVAIKLRQMLNDGGAFIHIGATTNRGVATDDDLGLPQPPHDAIEELVARYLGPVRRAGKGKLPEGTQSNENDVLKSCGFTGPEIHDLAGDEIVERSVDEVLSAVLSLSSSAPHLFGDRFNEFQTELRSLLTRSSSDGRFAEKTRDIRVSIWR